MTTPERVPDEDVAAWARHGATSIPNPAIVNALARNLLAAREHLRVLIGRVDALAALCDLDRGNPMNLNTGVGHHILHLGDAAIDARAALPAVEFRPKE